MRLFRRLTANHTTLEPYPFKKERVMQAFLMENSGVLSLGEEPFDVGFVQDEEIPVERLSSKSGKGRLDLLVQYEGTGYAVAELKNVFLDDKHLEQLAEYLIKSNLDKILRDEEKLEDTQWLGLLVGTGISESVKTKVSNGLSFNGIPVAALVLDRYRSEHGEIFVASDVYYKTPTGRDYTKYIFAGKKYHKNKLVLAIVKDFFSKNPDISADNLLKAFPPKLQGNHGVLYMLNDAAEIRDRTGRSRHYLKPDDVIRLEDNSQFVVCNQWGVDNLPRFLNHVQKHFGYKIEEAN